MASSNLLSSANTPPLPSPHFPLQPTASGNTSPPCVLFRLTLFLCCFTFCLKGNSVSCQSLYDDGYNCTATSPAFPEHAFYNQPNSQKVYLRVDSIGESSLRSAGLVKFCSVFGVRVVGDAGVANEKLIYVSTLLAELMDIRERGIPSNKNLASSLRNTHSMIVLVSSNNRLEMLSNRRYRPKELKCFVRAFHVALESAVKMDQSREIVCPRDAGLKDRARGLVGDFIVSKGYPATYPSDAEIGVRMRSFFLTAIERNWISTLNSRCQTRICLEIAFQSWAISSAMGSDRCWCLSSKEWAFCGPEEMRNGFAELWGTLAEELLVNGVMQPDGKYTSSAVIR